MVRRFLNFLQFQKSSLFSSVTSNLVVPEVTTEPGPREVETGNYEEFAEDEESFVDELGLE